MGVSNAIEGGYETARLTAAEQDKAWRAERQADALAFLTRTDNLDVAEVLGLVDSPKPKRATRKRIGSNRPTTRKES